MTRVKCISQYVYLMLLFFAILFVRHQVQLVSKGMQQQELIPLRSPSQQRATLHHTLCYINTCVYIINHFKSSYIISHYMST